MNNLEEYRNIDKVIERFIEVVKNAKPGSHIEFCVDVPKKKEEEQKEVFVQVHAISGKSGKNIRDDINKALEFQKITNPGYVAMDGNGIWYYYTAVPVAHDGYFHVYEGDAVELCLCCPDEYPIDWSKTIRYVY